MSIRAQLELFPGVNEETGITQEQCLKETFKLFDIVRSSINKDAREIFRYVVAMLTQTMRRGKKVPEWCSLSRYLDHYGDFIQPMSEYIMLAQQAPPCDYLGQVLGETGGLNSRLGQFFTPASICQLMNEMLLSNSPRMDRPYFVSDPCCGTGRMSLYAHLVRDDVMTFGVDTDMDLVRASTLTHWIHFEKRAGKWAFLCADSLSLFEAGTPLHPVWNYANLWDQPSWLAHDINYSSSDDQQLEDLYGDTIYGSARRADIIKAREKMIQ